MPATLDATGRSLCIRYQVDQQKVTEGDRNTHSNLTCASIQQCRAIWMKGQQIIHPGSNTIPVLSSTNEFREYEKPQVMNHFHYAYILIRLGLALALHSGEYEMQENLEACKRWDRNSTGLSQI